MEKYLKYKFKYINLNQQISGAQIEPVAPRNLQVNIPIIQGEEENCFNTIIEREGLLNDAEKEIARNLPQLRINKYSLTITTSGKNRNVHTFTDEITNEAQLRGIMLSNSELTTYGYNSTVSNESLKIFIILRLLNKLFHSPDEARDFGLQECNDIIKLIKNARFIELFNDFLRKQLRAILFTDLENKLVQFKGATQYPINSELRIRNYQYSRNIGREADDAWRELLIEAQTINPPNEEQEP
jgi:hypothetical protein